MTIKQQQNLLAYLGYYTGGIDGIAGKGTVSAAARFQADFGIASDGIVGAETEKALKHAVAYGMPERNGAEDSPVDSDFWDAIHYFTRGEFKCQCGGKYCNGFPAEMAEETVRIVDEIRRRAGVPITINSGVRCTRHNAEVGGVANSNHLTGEAADLHCALSPTELADIAEEVTAQMIPGRGGIGIYPWGIHVDNGAYSRWRGK